MLKRVISAAIMCLIGLPILFIGGNLFYVFVLLLGMFSLYEVINVRENKKEIPIFIKVISYLMFVLIFLLSSSGENFNVDYRIICSLMLSFLLPLIFYKRESYSINDAVYLIGFIFLISSSFNLIVYIRNMNNMVEYLVYVLLIAIFTDTFAYVAGSLVGNHKLVPSISPNKTIEGTIFGVVMGTLVACTYYYLFINDSINFVYLVLGTLFLSVLGQLGDLVFSVIKRYFGVKDFSNLIPGHGGILDRFDSTIFIVYGFILLIGIL